MVDKGEHQPQRRGSECLGRPHCRLGPTQELSFGPDRPKEGECQGHTFPSLALVLREIRKLPLASLERPFTYC